MHAYSAHHWWAVYPFHGLLSFVHYASIIIAYVVVNIGTWDDWHILAETRVLEAQILLWLCDFAYYKQVNFVDRHIRLTAVQLSYYLATSIAAFFTAMFATVRQSKQVSDDATTEHILQFVILLAFLLVSTRRMFWLWSPQCLNGEGVK